MHGQSSAVRPRRLTLLKLPRHIFTVLVPRATGDERGNTET